MSTALQRIKYYLTQASQTPAQHTITMWHGGRGLEYSYQEMLGNKSKQMEHGPGLYLTNFYSVASKYAKGGGKTYLVTFKRGTNIDDVTLKLPDVIKFIKANRFKNKPAILEFINNKYKETMRADNLVNLLINYECLQPAASALTRQYLVDNGVDYAVVHNFGGYNDQTVVIIFNPAVITSAKAIPADKVTPDQYKLPVDM